MKYILKENILGNESKYLTKLNVSFTNDSIIFDFESYDSKLYNAGSIFNDPLYNGDVVEVFLCLNNDLNHYYEIEVSPNNTRWFSYITNDLNGTFSGKYLNDLIFSSVQIIDNNYFTKIIVPFKVINYDGKSNILFNAFRIETEGGIINKNLLSVYPTLKNTFHDPYSFKILERD